MLCEAYGESKHRSPACMKCLLREVHLPFSQHTAKGTGLKAALQTNMVLVTMQCSCPGASGWEPPGQRSREQWYRQHISELTLSADVRAPLSALMGLFSLIASLQKQLREILSETKKMHPETGTWPHPAQSFIFFKDTFSCLPFLIV